MIFLAFFLPIKIGGPFAWDSRPSKEPARVRGKSNINADITDLPCGKLPWLVFFSIPLKNMKVNWDETG